MSKKIVFSLLLATLLIADEADDLLEGFDEPTAVATKAPSSTNVSTKTDALMDGFEDNDASDVSTSSKDDLLSGFDDTESSNQTDDKESGSWIPTGLEGKFTQSASYSFHNDAPHDGLSALKSLLFLEYNHAIFDDFKLKINANAFYDLSYVIKGREDFTPEDKDALESEVELFDAYIEGSLTDDLDIKLGHQVVVWGKSDTIRITDVINPLDNRRPGMVDIEDLRLPEAMIKLDAYHDNWRFSPIVILQQRFNKNPPFGGDFYPSPKRTPHQKTPRSPSYALNVAGEFSGFDVDFYLANIYGQDELGLPLLNHRKKMSMAGVAMNYVYDSWLLKSEFAYKKDFVFLQSGDKKYDRVDSLIGFEYNGIADTKLSYDIANKHMTKKTAQFEQDTYQHAFRATSDFLNATLHANYLISLFGKSLDKGGFQRAWVKYDIADGVSTNFGIVDYIGGSKLFDAIDDNDMLFVDVSYSF